MIKLTKLECPDVLCQNKDHWTAELMSYFDDAGKLTLEPGQFHLEVGGCSPGKRGQDLGAPIPQMAEFSVV